MSFSTSGVHGTLVTITEVPIGYSPTVLSAKQRLVLVSLVYTMLLACLASQDGLGESVCLDSSQPIKNRKTSRSFFIINQSGQKRDESRHSYLRKPNPEEHDHHLLPY